MSDTIWGAIIGIGGGLLVLYLSHVEMCIRDKYRQKSQACKKLLENAIDADSAMSEVAKASFGNLPADDAGGLGVYRYRESKKDTFLDCMHRSVWLADSQDMRDIYSLLVVLRHCAARFLVRSNSLYFLQESYLKSIDALADNPEVRAIHGQKLIRRYEAQELEVSDLFRELNAMSDYLKRWLSKKDKAATKYANSTIVRRLYMKHSSGFPSLSDYCVSYIGDIQSCEVAGRVWSKYSKKLENFIEEIGECPEVKHVVGRPYVKLWSRHGNTTRT